MVINVTTSEFYPFTQRNFLKRYQKKNSTPFFILIVQILPKPRTKKVGGVPFVFGFQELIDCRISNL